ncbi:MAG TPA: hypothetical protein VM933_11305 [Acidimicrobiales bacterium]|nr:hypothetical protein [Acidimicrobiales bacterium]
MTIRKGEAWGAPGPLPDDGVVVRTDAEARRALESARRDGRPWPVLGLLGGDLGRTLAAPGSEARLRSAEAMTFALDLGQVLVDGRLHLFVAHLVARNRWWTRAVVAMNAQWVGPWNLGPKAHPNDGRLDTFDARLPLGDLWKVRRRLPTGSHLPHPGITSRRATSVTFELERPLPVRLDGEVVDRGRVLAVRLEPDALRVVI